MKYNLSWRFRFKQQAAFWVVSILFIISGVLFIYLPEIINNINDESFTQKTSGTVIELVKSGKDLIYPVYEYKDGHGKIFREKSATGSSLTVFQKGETVNINYNPLNPEDFSVSGENDQLFKILKIIGLIFFILGCFIFISALLSLMIKIASPQNADFGNWWVNFTGGMLGAFSFSMPSTFIWAIYFYLPHHIQSAFLEKSFILWIFTGVGILVNIAVFFIAKSQLQGRPRWKS